MRLKIISTLSRDSGIVFICEDRNKIQYNIPEQILPKATFIGKEIEIIQNEYVVEVTRK